MESQDPKKNTINSTSTTTYLQSLHLTTTATMSYILLTGATGMLGSVILKQLLTADYKVNAILRSFAKSKAALAVQYASAVQSGQLIFTEIPDMGVDGVFDEPLKEASDFIHAATPLDTKNFYETIIKPVSIITANVLNTSANAPHLKRLVITGSIVSNFKIPDELMSGKTISEKDFSTVTLEEGKSNVGYAYGYSKVTSEKEAWAFMEKEKPKFELVYLLAPAIIGKNMQGGWVPTKDALGGASNVYKALFDVKAPGSLFPYYM
jgi:NADPH-dependent methylglyoxal reductase